jgi:hypothetical protein
MQPDPALVVYHADESRTDSQPGETPTYCVRLTYPQKMCDREAAIPFSRCANQGILDGLVLPKVQLSGIGFCSLKVRILSKRGTILGCGNLSIPV